MDVASELLERADSLKHEIDLEKKVAAEETRAAIDAEVWERVCVRLCVCARLRACMRGCVGLCVRSCVCACVCVFS